MAPKEMSRTYEANGDATFQAVVRAVERVGMKVKEIDDTRGVVTATTGVTIWSWGERVEVRVAPATSGTTNVTVSIALKFQLFGWGQQLRVATGLLDEIGRQVTAVSAPPPPPSLPPPPPPG
jgi:hypothetical protein